MKIFKIIHSSKKIGGGFSHRNEGPYEGFTGRAEAELAIEAMKKDAIAHGVPSYAEALSIEEFDSVTHNSWMS